MFLLLCHQEVREAQPEVVRVRIRQEVRENSEPLNFETQVRRWHPDKFHQKQGQRIKKEHKEEVAVYTQ